MLMARPLDASPPVLKKRVMARDVSEKNAFAHGTRLWLSLHVPRALGARGTVLRLHADGVEYRDLPFTFSSTAGTSDIYTLILPLFQISPETGGFFEYELLFLRGADTLFSHTEDQVNMTLSPVSRGRFFLTVYADDFQTPRTLWGRTMYHVFVDRFARGGGAERRDAVYHRRWDGEIMQYPSVAGAHVENNEFFGGTLWGVREKIPYLRALGVGALYLSPIFRAYSNHKYDTADYGEVDLGFGGESALSALLDECKKYDIIVVLDGVFNHTGDHSRYFERRGDYGGEGAYLSPHSQYADWYSFFRFPDEYESWWGIPILPRLRLENPAVREYFLGERGIVSRYLKMGVGGWRLDVADELPDGFLCALRARVKGETGGNGVIFGEVWENAAAKIAYGKRRRYLQGQQLDGVMNYPLREGIVAFVRDGDARALARVLRELWATYPTCVCHALMNVLSTHDTARILTVLGGAHADGYTMSELRDIRLSEAEKRIAVARLKIAAALQYAAFGIPSLYYGDEVGLEGYGDPFCRRPFPWGREDGEILAHYRQLGRIRCENSAFCDGDFKILHEDAHALVLSRKNKENHIVVLANRGERELAWSLPCDATELLTGTCVKKGQITVPADSVRIWRIDDVQKGMGKMDEKQKSRKQALSL